LVLGLRWRLPQDLDALRLLMRTRLETMTQTVMASLVGWRSIWTPYLYLVFKELV
jgi:hypothetical protein